MTVRAILGRFGYDPDDPVPADEDGRNIPGLLVRNLARAPFVAEADIDLHIHARQHNPLTPPEVEALRFASRGLNVPQTGDATGKSAQTVQTQLKTARYRLRAKNTTHAVAEAIRRGLIP